METNPYSLFDCQGIKCTFHVNFNLFEHTWKMDKADLLSYLQLHINSSIAFNHIEKKHPIKQPLVFHYLHKKVQYLLIWIFHNFTDHFITKFIIIVYVLSTMGVSKESISKFLIGNLFHVKLRILSPYSNRT